MKVNSLRQLFEGHFPLKRRVGSFILSTKKEKRKKKKKYALPKALIWAEDDLQSTSILKPLINIHEDF